MSALFNHYYFNQPEALEAQERKRNDDFDAAWEEHEKNQLEIEHMEQALRNGICEPVGFVVDGQTIDTTTNL